MADPAVPADDVTRRRIGLAVIAATLAVSLAAVALLFVGHARTGSWISAGDVPSEEDRANAIAVAQDFCLRIDAIDGDDPEAYRASVLEVTTTKYKSEFAQELGIPEGAKGEGRVHASGVQSIDRDSASVLVIHDNQLSFAGSTEQQSLYSRWIVDLKKVGGRWLVDDYTPVS